MPITTKTVLPIALYTNLSRVSPALDVPAGLLGYTIRMSSTEFVDPSLTCSLSIDQSFDGGVTWSNVGGFLAAGGHDRAGNPLQPSEHVDLTDQQRASAQMRATIGCQGAWHYGFLIDLET